MLSYIAVLMIILGSGNILGWTIPGFGWIQLILAIATTFLVKIKYGKMLVRKNTFFSLIIIVALFCGNIILTAGVSAVFMYTGQLITFICLFLLVDTFDRKKLISTYTNLMVFFALASLLFWSLAQMDIAIGDYYIKAENGLMYRMNPLYIYRIGTETGIHTTLQTRNTGLFWEPGAYQGYLNLALLFLLVGTSNTEKNKVWKIRVAILTITVLSTQSTMGYFILVLNYLIFFFIRMNPGKISARTIVFMSLGLAAIFVVLNSGVVQDKFNSETGQYQSFVIRLNDNRSGIEACFVSPLIGLGYKTQRYIEVVRGYGITHNSTGLLITIQQFGLFMGSVILYRIMINIKKCVDVRGFASILFILMIVLLFSNESYIDKQFITLFLFPLSDRPINKIDKKLVSF